MTVSEAAAVFAHHIARLYEKMDERPMPPEARAQLNQAINAFKRLDLPIPMDEYLPRN